MTRKKTAIEIVEMYEELERFMLECFAKLDAQKRASDTLNN